jgi:hypothetical protein
MFDCSLPFGPKDHHKLQVALSIDPLEVGNMQLTETRVLGDENPA